MKAIKAAVILSILFTVLTVKKFAKEEQFRANLCLIELKKLQSTIEMMRNKTENRVFKEIEWENKKINIDEGRRVINVPFNLAFTFGCENNAIDINITNKTLVVSKTIEIINGNFIYCEKCSYESSIKEQIFSSNCVGSGLEGIEEIAVDILDDLIK